MSLPALTREEWHELRDLLLEIEQVLKRPPFESRHLEDQAKWLRVPGERWPSAALLSNGRRPDSPTARMPSRKFYRRVKKFHYAIFHEWPGGTKILRLADEEGIVVLEDFDPYDPSPIPTYGDLRNPGDVALLNGNRNAPHRVILAGDPEKVIVCEICGQPLYRTTWNRKYHAGECREMARERWKAARRALRSQRARLRGG